VSDLDKLRAVQGLSQTIGDFLDWLSERGIVLCRPERHHYCPIPETAEQLLAQYFQIDLNKVEAEKRVILEKLRSVQRR